MSPGETSALGSLVNDVSTHHMAEGVGFEPTRHFCPLVFKTSSIGRSDSPPRKILRHLRFDAIGQASKRLRNPVLEKVADHLRRVHPNFFRCLPHRHRAAFMPRPLEHLNIVSAITYDHAAIEAETQLSAHNF